MAYFVVYMKLSAVRVYQVHGTDTRLTDAGQLHLSTNTNAILNAIATTIAILTQCKHRYNNHQKNNLQSLHYQQIESYGLASPPFHSQQQPIASPHLRNRCMRRLQQQLKKVTVFSTAFTYPKPQKCTIKGHKNALIN